MGKKREEGAVKEKWCGDLEWKEEIEGEMEETAEERTLVTNHLPRRKSAVKAIHQRDKANIDGANCLFSSSPNSFQMKCAIKVMQSC